MSTGKPIGRPFGSKNLIHKGRYSKKYAARLAKNFRGIESKTPTFEGFAASLGVTLATLKIWYLESPDFAAACEIALNIQRSALLDQIAAGTCDVEFSRTQLEKSPFWVEVTK